MIRKLLSRLRCEVITGPDGSVYLRRYTILDAFGWRLMLHEILRPDYGRELHDHPWWFLTLILRGGYVEKVARTGRQAAVTELIHRKPGRVCFRPAEYAHTIIELPRGTAWTLVLRGRRVRMWGFYTDCGWQPWRTYVDRVHAGRNPCDTDEGGAAYAAQTANTPKGTDE